MRRESFLQSLLVATCLCIVCSVLVSTAAVTLRPYQEANKKRQMQMDVLKVAGLYEEGVEISEQFEAKVITEMVDLETGNYVDPDSLDPKARDAKAAARDPELSVVIPRKKDLAGLKRREKYGSIFLIKDDQGQPTQLILPVRGKGLWSTMYGFLSLQPDGRTVNGITFYEHGETPGLGGEIESDKFCRQWEGKMVRDADSGAPRFEFVRGSVDPQDKDKMYKIDGIAGATITTRGVTDMILFWMGPMGYKPLLERLSPKDIAGSRPPSRDSLATLLLTDESVFEER